MSGVRICRVVVLVSLGVNIARSTVVTVPLWIKIEADKFQKCVIIDGSKHVCGLEDSNFDLGGHGPPRRETTMPVRC